MKWVVKGTAGAREVEVERRRDGFTVVVDGVTHLVDLIFLDRQVASLRFPADGRSFNVSFQRHAKREYRVGVGEREFALNVLTPVESVEVEAAAAIRGPSRIEAPIPGKVVAVNVAVGDQVEPGQPLVVLEAMKMENELASEQAGTVAAVHVQTGATVEAGTPLVELE